MTWSALHDLSFKEAPLFKVVSVITMLPEEHLGFDVGILFDDIVPHLFALHDSLVRLCRPRQKNLNFLEAVCL